MKWTYGLTVNYMLQILYSSLRLESGKEDRRPNDYADVNMQMDHHFNHQCTCLNMTRGSKLRMLEGLKDSRVFGVVRMTTRIGVEEVQ